MQRCMIDTNSRYWRQERKQLPKMKLTEQEIDLARMFIQNMTEPFDATAYQDEYQARLREAIMTKDSPKGKKKAGTA